MSAPNLIDILLDPALGPEIISILPLPQKKAVLCMLHPINPDLVTHYLQLLWSNSWTWRGGKHYSTGLCQEELPFCVRWPHPQKMTIADLDIKPPYW